MSRILFTAIVLCTFVAVSQQQSETTEKVSVFLSNSCTSKTTCSQCIQASKCAWCMDPAFGDRPRCFKPDEKLPQPCDEAFVINPDNEQIMISDRKLSKGGKMIGGGYEEGMSVEGEESASGSISGGGSAASGGGASGSASASGSVTQIRPQHVGLKLRINEMHSMKMSYAQAQDYPVDLYYLMDLSKSMEDDKDKLSDLGSLLSSTMQNITSNFRLGFGSFVDKVLMPYVSTVPKKLQSPCEGCEAPYGFKNHLSLTTESKQFSAYVKNAHVSGNLDAPEGGFDAIMQAVVCENQIGWRKQARRLLVFSTDAGFHYAGDGKLGGIITPNDGECHMEDNQYTHSTILDYPSISQINLKVKQNSVNIIFAVTESQHEVYKRLSKHVEGSSSAVLKDDSSNVVELVKDEYDKITSSVEMKHTAQGSVEVKYWSKCRGDTLVETNKCDGLKVGDVVEFEARITVKSCPANPADRKQTFKIYPVGVGEELTVDLEMLCTCGCETSGPAFEENSPKCKGAGTLSCGICECHEGFFGRNCECNNKDLGGSGADFNKCRPDNTTDIECFGRGNCVCGQCQCNIRDSPDEIISGKFCECDNFSCDRHNSILCSGPENGVCECGTCNCFDGWEGAACDCSTSKANCMAPNGKECSGHGQCNCGRCECEIKDDVRYSGKYCEKCPTCPGRCDELKSCVECQMYKKGLLKDHTDCAANCTLFTPISEESVLYDEDKDEHLCTFYDEDDCRYRFVYNETVEKNGEVTLHVRAQEHLECPPKVFLLGIVLGVIAAIVLIGLAMLLLWKLLTTIHDRREFARFEKERMMAKWDTGENPIYKQATSTFKNPTYAGK